MLDLCFCYAFHIKSIEEFMVNIINSNMRRQSLRNNTCTLCSAPSREHKFIMASLSKKLKKLSFEFDLPRNQEKTELQKNQGFIRIIHALQLVREENIAHYQRCQHHFWIKRLKRFLDCSSKQLDYLCHLAANYISEKSYHFYLIQAQIKNCMERCSQANPLQVQEPETKNLEKQGKKESILKIQESELKQKEQSQVQAQSENQHQSFLPIQEYGSWIYDATMGMWYQAPFFWEQQ